MMSKFIKQFDNVNLNRPLSEIFLFQTDGRLGKLFDKLTLLIKHVHAHIDNYT